MTIPLRALVILGLFTCIALFPSLSAQERATEPPAKAADEIIDLSGLKSGDKLPRMIQAVAPVYPYEMKKAGLTGSVTLEFIINDKGDVTEACVVKSNNPWFERPAMDAVSKWKFHPGELDGRPVNVRASQNIEFRLEDSRGEESKLWQVTRGKDHEKLPLHLQWDVAPVPTYTLYPVYPYEQLAAGVAGEAKIAYIVGPEGKITSSQLKEATSPEFGLAVMAMMDAWQFTPPTKKDGSPASALLTTEYEFQPNGRGSVPVTASARDILKILNKNPDKIVSPRALDEALQPLDRGPPVFPTALAQAGQAGKAMIEFFIDKEGDAQLPRIVSSSAPEFGHAAALAVATWRFKPPLKSGKPVITRVRVPVEFALPDVR